MSSESFQSTYFHSQPFFVVTDDAYERLLQKLKRGESAPTYHHGCPSAGKPNPEAHCTCVSFDNVLVKGGIERRFKNESKPVIPVSVLMFYKGKLYS